MEDLAIIIDGRMLDLYGLGKARFFAGTELLVQRLAAGLAERGHEVHVITPDLDHAEHRGVQEWWWPPAGHPTVADVVIAAHGLEFVGDLRAPFLVLLANAIDPPLGGVPASAVTVAALSEIHMVLLAKHAGIRPEQCVIVGAGVDVAEYPARPKKVPGRMLWASSPDRGLWHMLDIFDRVKLAVPEATLHVAYGFEEHFERQKWHAHALAELLWECRARLEHTPGVVNLGAISRSALVAEQVVCEVHAYPCDPANVGSQLHGITALELAAAGAALVVSDVEALPEVFGCCAEVLPVPGALRKRDKKRGLLGRFDAQDWADAIVQIMQQPRKRARMVRGGRAVAAANTWETYIDRWEGLLQGMIEQRQEIRPAA